MKEKVFKFVENNVVTVTITALIAGLALVTFINRPANNITASTVMITRPDMRSGGTGVILTSSNTKSEVLTNGHVCEVVKNGGLVTTTNKQQYSVTGFKKSFFHDLCMIEVSNNLHTNTILSSNSPYLYEHATISGHPHLYPNVVTYGHFSNHKIISVLTGFKECSPEDLLDPTKAPYCIFLGKLPLISQYEAQLVTATIMAGSSGSGVYNSNAELSALVFAGSSEIGYAFTVPYEYVYNFVNNEAPYLHYEQPNTTMTADQLDGQSRNEKIKIKELCQTSVREDIVNFCNIVNNDLIERN